MSERTSLSSRHRRRKSLPDSSSNPRAGSVDPLLGAYSDDSGAGHHAASRAGDTHSVARSYNETIIRPVTRPLHSSTGGASSFRGSRSHVGTSEVRYYPL